MSGSYDAGIGGIARQFVKQGRAFDCRISAKVRFRQLTGRHGAPGLASGDAASTRPRNGEASSSPVGRGHAANRRCRIEGGINAKGQRIVHAPNQRD